MRPTEIALSAAQRSIIARYWRARRVFERVLRETPPELLGLAPEGLEQLLADIDLPGGREIA